MALNLSHFYGKCKQNVLHVVSDAVSFIPSSMATLAPAPLGIVTDLPATLDVATSARVAQKIVASGGKTPYTYAWKKDGAPISETGDTLIIGSAKSSDAGVYEVAISGADHNTKDSAQMTLTVS